MLVVLSYNMGGYILVLKWLETYNRNKVQESLTYTNDSQLELLKITDVSLLIRTENHEIIYAGNRYDVQKEFSKDGITYFYCYNDKEEEHLYVALHTSINNHSDSQSEKQNGNTSNLLKHIIKDYYLNDAIVKIPITIIVQEAFSFKETFLPINFFSVATPPPKRIFS